MKVRQLRLAPVHPLSAQAIKEPSGAAFECRLAFVRFTWTVTTSASSTFNDHIGQPSPINANDEFGLTVAATQNRRINATSSMKFYVETD